MSIALLVQTVRLLTTGFPLSIRMCPVLPLVVDIVVVSLVTLVLIITMLKCLDMVVPI